MKSLVIFDNNTLRIGMTHGCFLTLKFQTTDCMECLEFLRDCMEVEYCHDKKIGSRTIETKVTERLLVTLSSIRFKRWLN